MFRFRRPRSAGPSGPAIPPWPARFAVGNRSAAALAIAALPLLGGCQLAGPPTAGPTSIGVYSGRHYNTDKALYRQFQERTGIRVHLLEGKDDALIERLRNEGSRSPADVLVLVDAARLTRAADAGLFQPIRSSELERLVPAPLRDPQGRWFSLTRRVRAVVVNPALVPPDSIRSYEDLASPALRGKLCLRNSRNVYNQSLVADQIIRRGEAATTTWVKGMVANLGRPLFTSDIPLARAVGQGRCGVALVNTYYVARMLSGEAGADDQAIARRLKVILPDPAHVNVSGAGVTRSARNPRAAQALIEFLASPSGGRGYAAANHEYPLQGSGDHPILRGFGPLRPDAVSIQQMGRANQAAVRLMQAGGWL